MRGLKKQIYQDKLKVPEYYWFDPHNPEDFQGFFLKKSKPSKVYVYEPIAPDAQNRLVSKNLGLALTHWYGTYGGITTTWLRWKTLGGELLLTSSEIQTQRANAEAKRANAEAKRANVSEQQAQAEVKRANAAEERAQVAFSDGEKKKTLEVARNMLAKGLDSALVADITGLSIDELATLIEIKSVIK